MKDRRKNTFTRYVFYVSMFAYMNPLMVIESVEIKNYEYMWDRVVALCEV
jgi:hypothetical protein